MTRPRRTKPDSSAPAQRRRVAARLRRRTTPGRPAGRRDRRLAARAMAVTVICGTALGVATPAMAIHIPNPLNWLFGNCKNQPTAQAPGQGVSGWAQIKPAAPPAPAAAFGTRPASTEYIQYGYAGLFWSTYDQGCVPTNFATMLDTALGDYLMGAAKVTVAVDNTVHTWASDPSWMNNLTPLVTGASGTLYKALFVTWAAVALIIVAISVFLRAHHADMPSAVTLAAWAVLVIALVSGVVAAPAWAGQQVSGLMSTTLNALDAGFVGPGGQAHAAQAHDSLTVSTVLYPNWLRGEFGDPNAPIARQYGAQLFQAQALTWAQAAASPQQVAATDKADKSSWGTIASKVQSADPQVYSAIQGNANGRIGAGLLALLTAIIVCGFDLIASLVVIAALLAVLAGVILLPGIGVAGMHHGMRHLITGTGSKIFGMLVNGVLWAAAAGIDQVATRALLTQTVLPQALALLLLAVLPVALWMLLRKLRGRPAIPKLARRAAMLGLGYAAMRRGARRGAEDALAEPGPDEPPDMYWRDPWTWRADTRPPGPPPVVLPPAPPPAPPVGGGPGGTLPPPGGPGAGPRPLPPSPRPALPPGPGGNGSGPGPDGNGPGPQPGGNGTGPEPGPAGGGAAVPPSPPPPPDPQVPAPEVPVPVAPLPGAAEGPREYTGTPRPPAADGDEIIPAPDRIFRPGEVPPDQATTYDGGSLYDGGSGASPAVPPPWEHYTQTRAAWQRAARTPAPPPPDGGIPRQPAGTWQYAGEHPHEQPEPGDDRARVWIENDPSGVYVVVERALGISRNLAADDEQAELAARHASQWPWR